ncbi:MAG: class I SAM-dependent methyltransferase [Chloroflexota bacterium]|nr:class I SAM-dependent methyltransferase [Chloroflexota bacterium]
MSRPSKALALLSLLPRRPHEFYSRAAAVVQRRLEEGRIAAPAYESVPWGQAIEELREQLGASSLEPLEEPALKEIEEKVRGRLAEVSSHSPIRQTHNADFTLARTCYAACRLLQPDVVVETGVAHGITSAHILAALAQNERGVLHSVDLPPLGKDADEYVGAAVPEELRGRWRLRRGVSKQLLPKIVAEVGSLDIFVHDSLHTYLNMRWEFATVLPRLRPGGVILADDMQDNAAFDELRRSNPALWRVVREEGGKESLFGVLVK